jgi:stress-induced morphogen
MVAVEDLRARLAAAFPDGEIHVEDTTGDGDHFDVHVRTARFAGVGLVGQHRMVYGALGDLMARIHALSLRTEPA